MTQTFPSSDVPIVTLPFVKQEIDKRLDDFFQQKVQQAMAVSTSYAELWQATAQVAASGGKRIRPYILLLSYQAFAHNSDTDAVVSAAMAQELLHVAMLIHDDIIDRDMVRHGVKNVTGQYRDMYLPLLPEEQENLHFANSAAVLAGDLLISQAYALLAQCDVDPARQVQANEIMTEAVFNVVGGELMDTELAFRQVADVNAAVVADYKTASYSFISPLVMGARLAGASDEAARTLVEFGQALGIAYQYEDDWLGVFGDEQRTGKSVSGDIREGKRTLMIERFTELADETQQHEFMQLFGRNDATEEEVERVRALLIQSGAKRAVELAIAEQAERARHALSRLELHEAWHEAFLELVERCTNRSK